MSAAVISLKEKRKTTKKEVITGESTSPGAASGASGNEGCFLGVHA